RGLPWPAGGGRAEPGRACRLRGARGRCCTTSTAAGSVPGSWATSLMRAGMPPAEVPITRREEGVCTVGKKTKQVGSPQPQWAGRRATCKTRKRETASYSRLKNKFTCQLVRWLPAGRTLAWQLPTGPLATWLASPAYAPALVFVCPPTRVGNAPTGFIFAIMTEETALQPVPMDEDTVAPSALAASDTLLVLPPAENTRPATRAAQRAGGRASGLYAPARSARAGWDAPAPRPRVRERARLRPERAARHPAAVAAQPAAGPAHAHRLLSGQRGQRRPGARGGRYPVGHGHRRHHWPQAGNGKLRDGDGRAAGPRPAKDICPHPHPNRARLQLLQAQHGVSAHRAAHERAPDSRVYPLRALPPGKPAGGRNAV
nr:hypothetical protein [Tanacetum cinerariifolium]